MDSVEEHIRERDCMLDELRLNLTKAQQVLKKNADLKRREEGFEIGDMVYLKLQPYLIVSHPWQEGHLRNLLLDFMGHLRCSRKVGTIAYMLQLPFTCKLHPLFHVSQYKRDYTGFRANGGA